MKVLREELQTAVNLAAAVIVDHSIPSFTKVWLRDGVVSAFNGQIGIDTLVEGLPAIGGVDGKEIKKIIDSFSDEELDLSVGAEGQLQLTGERSNFTLNVTDLESFIDTNLEDQEPILQVPVEALSDFNMPAMVKLRELRGDPMLDLTALNIYPQPEEDRLVLFASDRYTLNRSFWSIGSAEHKAVKVPIHIPLDYIKLLAKLRGNFADGEMVISDHHIKTVRDGIKLYSKLVVVPVPLKFEDMVRPCWPDGKFSKKLLIPIPDGLSEALNKAEVLSTNDKDDVEFRVLDGELTVSAKTGKGKFSETFQLDGPHANIERKFSAAQIQRVLPNVDRMYIGQRALVLFGPLRFSAFIAARYL
jgi:DNA polymerase III sliding clamp (beta) subunit (PCNA family)